MRLCFMYREVNHNCSIMSLKKTFKWKIEPGRSKTFQYDEDVFDYVTNPIKILLNNKWTEVTGKKEIELRD